MSEKQLISPQRMYIVRGRINPTETMIPYPRADIAPNLPRKMTFAILSTIMALYIDAMIKRGLGV